MSTQPYNIVVDNPGTGRCTCGRTATVRIAVEEYSRRGQYTRYERRCHTHADKLAFALLDKGAERVRGEVL